MGLPDSEPAGGGLCQIVSGMGGNKGGELPNGELWEVIKGMQVPDSETFWG